MIRGDNLQSKCVAMDTQDPPPPFSPKTQAWSQGLILRCFSIAPAVQSLKGVANYSIIRVKWYG